MKKVCRICKEEKEIEDFYKHKEGKDGHFNNCKQCFIKDNSRRKLENWGIYKFNYYKKRKKLGFILRYELPKKDNNLLIKEWYKQHPEANKAGHLVRHLVGNHSILKPNRCAICGEEKKLHGHHPDYSKPLEIIWCCPTCHKQLHREIKKAA